LGSERGRVAGSALDSAGAPEVHNMISYEYSHVDLTERRRSALSLMSRRRFKPTGRKRRTPALLSFAYLVVLVPGLSGCQGQGAPEGVGKEPPAAKREMTFVPANAEGLIRANGFVVDTKEDLQIFEPYVQGTMPVLVTVDSAFETFVCLLNRCVTYFELMNAWALRKFVREMHRTGQ
jgi:hypothetical protein